MHVTQARIYELISHAEEIPHKSFMWVFEFSYFLEVE